MKFVCSQNDLNSHLSLANRAVPSRAIQPILANLLVVADSQAQKVSITGFDRVLGICSTFNAEVEESGSITLPAKLFSDIVARLPEAEISLEYRDYSEENAIAILSSASGRFQIRATSASEYPQLPQVKTERSLKLPVSLISEGLKGTLFATSNEEIKQILTGVHLRKKEGLEFAAIDGHRLAVVETEINEEIDSLAEQDFGITIPARALRELEKALARSNAKDLVTLTADESQIVFELNDCCLNSCKLEGDFPAYDQLIPKQFSRSVILERKRLLASLELVGVFADRSDNIVKFTIDGSNNKISLSVNAQDLGNAKESLPAQIVGDDIEIGFNVKYLMDGLKAIPATEIKMQLNEWNQPVIFTPISGIKMTYLVMPVQIKE
jgi:DNA polymerase-3 subunit beta